MSEDTCMAFMGFRNQQTYIMSGGPYLVPAPNPTKVSPIQFTSGPVLRPLLFVSPGILRRLYAPGDWKTGDGLGQLHCRVADYPTHHGAKIWPFSSWNILLVVHLSRWVRQKNQQTEKHHQLVDLWTWPGRFSCFDMPDLLLIKSYVACLRHVESTWDFWPEMVVLCTETKNWWMRMKSPMKVYMICWLVVWTPLKNMKVNWDDDIPNIWKNKPVMFQSPPTSLGYPMT